MTQGSSVKFETAALQKSLGCDMHAVAEEADMTPQEAFRQRIWVGRAEGWLSGYFLYPSSTKCASPHRPDKKDKHMTWFGENRARPRGR